MSEFTPPESVSEIVNLFDPITLKERPQKEGIVIQSNQAIEAA
jgi:hypothetical protein